MSTEPFLQIRDRSWVFDLALCLVVALVTLTAYGASNPFSFGLVAGILLVVPLMLRRMLPGLALALGVVAALATLVSPDPPLLVVVAVPILVYSLARFATPGIGQLALAAGLVGSVLGPAVWVLAPGGLQATNLLSFLVGGAACAGIVTAAYLIGRRRREAVENSADRARSVAEREQLVAAEQTQRDRVAAAAERNRIARELHDIVAHSLSVIVVQAEGGRALALKRPEKGPEVLGTIAETSRDALEEMRRMVGLLRSGGQDQPAAAYAPAPGLEDLPDLVRKTSDRVRLAVVGAAPPVSPTLGLSAYRIVQESLTNVLKHAGPAATARVTVYYAPRAISIEVVDDGRGAATAPGNPFSPGHGLRGMRERVTLHGGELTAQPRPGGGFVVRAWLPLDTPTPWARR